MVDMEVYLVEMNSSINNIDEEMDQNYVTRCHFQSIILLNLKVEGRQASSLI